MLITSRLDRSCLIKFRRETLRLAWMLSLWRIEFLHSLTPHTLEVNCRSGNHLRIIILGIIEPVPNEGEAMRFNGPTILLRDGR